MARLSHRIRPTAACRGTTSGALSVWIKNVSIEGGVLDGFNEDFDAALNVVIGGRGTGKSSVVELIRFCLGATSYTTASERESAEHALGVLGEGRVTITLTDGKDQIVVSRTALDSEPEKDGPYPAPFVFSQSEIESIGLQASSRLRLIDGFLHAEDRRGQDHAVTARVRSITAEIRSLLAEVDDLEEKTAELPKQKSQLAMLMAQRTAQSSVHDEIDGFRKSLTDLTPSIASAHVRAEAIQRSAERLGVWVGNLDHLLELKPSLEPWPKQIGTADELADLRKRETQAIARVRSGFEELQAISTELQRHKEIAVSFKTGVENSARELRVKMEEKQKGTSAVERQITELTQQISVLKSLIDLRRTRAERIAGLTEQRGKLISAADKHRNSLTKRRQEIAAWLNKELGPGVRVTVLPFAQRREYVSALGAALRGSGLRYNDLAERLAEIYSPTEIAQLAERRDVKNVADALEISEERALRLCDALRSDSGTSLFSTVVDDDVSIELMDGADYKGIDFLSMGQRCTAVLPIILRHMERIIVLDQPEDHLDNAFVVNTLVKAIASRSVTGQTIVATHNPNVPVIGNAQLVFQLDSDGSRCFVRQSAGLNSPRIVEAISTIMEGGREAFQRRAAFYSETETDVFS